MTHELIAPQVSPQATVPPEMAALDPTNRDDAVVIVPPIRADALAFSTFEDLAAQAAGVGDTFTHKVALSAATVALHRLHRDAIIKQPESLRCEVPVDITPEPDEAQAVYAFDPALTAATQQACREGRMAQLDERTGAQVVRTAVMPASEIPVYETGSQTQTRISRFTLPGIARWKVVLSVLTGSRISAKSSEAKQSTATDYYSQSIAAQERSEAVRAEPTEVHAYTPAELDLLKQGLEAAMHQADPVQKVELQATLTLADAGVLPTIESVRTIAARRGLMQGFWHLLGNYGRSVALGAE